GSEETRFIAVSGLATAAHAARALAAGFDEYLPKPVSPAHLIDIVRACMGGDPEADHPGDTAAAAAAARVGGEDRRSLLWNTMLSLLGRITDLSPGTDDIDSLINQLLASTLDACGFPRGAAYLVQPSGGLSLAAQVGFPASMRDGLMGFFGEHQRLREVARQGTLLSIDESLPAGDSLRGVLPRAKIGSMLLAPLSMAGQALGI